MVPAPAVRLTARPLTRPERLRLLARHWAHLARVSLGRWAAKHGRWWLALTGEQPSSIGGHFRELHSLEWLPEDYDGTGWKIAGFAWGYTLGAVFVIAGDGISALRKPLRFALAAFFIVLFVVLPATVLAVIHH